MSHDTTTDPTTVTNPTGLAIPSLTALVVGSMIGGGIFGLPSQMARAAALGPLLIGWALTGVGMLMLAFTYQSLANRYPEVNGGVYGYARAGFGNFIGYCSAIGYWIGAWIGNVAFLVLLGSAIGTFIPSFVGGNTLPSIAFTSVILWVVHALVLRGVQEAAVVNVIVTVAKVVPLVTFVVVGIFAFRFDFLTADIWGTATQVYADGGTELLPLGGTMSQVVAMMLITVWVFSGVEGAAVFSERARRRSDVGKATVIGFLFVLALYMLINIMSYGIMSQTDVSGLADPSLAGVFAEAVGPWGAGFISIGLIVSLLGVLLSWVLLATEILRVPAEEGVMPRSFGRVNDRGTPPVALWTSNIAAQVTLILTYFSSSTYEFLIFLASGTILIPYLWSALFQLKTAWRGERITQGKSVTYERVVGLVAVLYTIWLMYAGRDYILPSAAVYLVLVPLYVKARREVGEAKAFTPFELVVLAALAAMTVAFAVQLATGTSAF